MVMLLWWNAMVMHITKPIVNFAAKLPLLTLIGHGCVYSRLQHLLQILQLCHCSKHAKAQPLLYTFDVRHTTVVSVHKQHLLHTA